MTREEAISALTGMQSLTSFPARTDALDMAISALREQPRWISVEERLPDDTLYGKNILICIKNRWGEQRVDTVHWWGLEHRLNSSWFWVDVTHWMPLPEPPEVVK
jgi:hypothetical protein